MTGRERIEPDGERGVLETETSGVCDGETKGGRSASNLTELVWSVSYLCAAAKKDGSKFDNGTGVCVCVDDPTAAVPQR